MATTTQTLSERENYLEAFEREYQVTRRVLKAFPVTQGKLKFSGRSSTASQVAWTLVIGQRIVEPILTAPRLEPLDGPMPADFKMILAHFERAHANATAALAKLDDRRFNTTIVMPSGPKGATMAMRRGDALWRFIHDTIHHRGQFSVYLRASGAKVPSIYGPSGDEPWD